MEIRILDERTIDKIAAGEVVERPASVVKELVENAMDCGADAVTVEIKEGGIAMIRVTDNGSGIEKAQVPKAFLRHATSKITRAKDLERLTSLGFRGEALSSICAVAQVEMITRTEKDLTGLRYVIEGGTEKESEEIGAPEGTTVIVRNLFYNVPARKKFLKTSQSEGGHVSDLMEHLALSHPHISFKYVWNGQIKFHTAGNGNLQEIIYRIYGKDMASSLVPLETEKNGMKLAGFLGTPAAGRANRNFENYFINGRFIKSPVIAKAAEDAYKPYLMQHKYPFLVLHLTVSPDSLDVNVHPSKMEVRFHEPRRISDFIYSAVRNGLAEKEMLKEVTFSEPSGEEEKCRQESVSEQVPEPFEKTARKIKEQQMQERKLQEQTGFGEVSPEVSEETVWKSSSNTELRETEAPQRVAEEGVYHTKLLGAVDFSGNRENGSLHSNVIKKDQHILVERPVQMHFFEDKLLSEEKKDSYQIIGQIFDTYWLVALGDKLLIIDQHAAHEKVKYERLCEQIRRGETLSQQVCPPVILTFSGQEESIFLEYAQYFRKMGFEIEPFGGNEYAVRAVPTELFGRSARELLEEVLDELAQGPVKGEPDTVASRLASMSCKAAVKGGKAMSVREAEALLDELLTLDNPYHCPHGRPTVITMSKHELEKKFSRIV